MSARCTPASLNSETEEWTRFPNRFHIGESIIETKNENYMNTFKCTVDNRWMWGLESACITINSPRGGYVRVDKWHMDKLTDTQYELVLKCVRSENNSNAVELTMDEMKELAVIGKIAGTVSLPYSKLAKIKK